MKKLLLVALVCLTGCEMVPASKEECTDQFTLAQAVIDRDLSWDQVLVCQDGQE